MEPKIITISAKKTIGFSIKTNMVNDQTVKIWQQLMPRLKEVKNAVSADLFSLQVYNGETFEEFTPTTEFTKYALVELKNYDFIPEGFEKFEIPAGQYAVFIHKGTSADFPKTSQIIYGEWLPNSEYKIDNRPHFAVMGDKYLGHENPETEEEVWVPIQNKV
ncbi:AraC family transcriptional regulator [Flavobacterium sp. 316]|uniref:GyrI-like domain-containing protein n=1 Tax=Flavobacterium sp. 316 TaxID=1603293 RepID=UPI0005DD240B|nr:GyrI-like domain-containing protein [Flavobacterium sp. 316]KIX19940.1 AraC family transcriptional regulator [Flavobacterium sp. 316]